MALDKPIAPSCLRNQEPILDCLRAYLSEGGKTLEIGSGTGQHAVFVTERLPELVWQPTELASQIQDVKAWVDDSENPNLLDPIELDVDAARPAELFKSYQFVFTANTLHFVSIETGINIIKVASDALALHGLFFIYGPFNDNGRYTSEGNVGLDEWLKSRDPLSGIRDIQWFRAQAELFGFEELACHQLPANNLILVMQKNKNEEAP